MAHYVDANKFRLVCDFLNRGDFISVRGVPARSDLDCACQCLKTLEYKLKYICIVYISYIEYIC